MLATTPESAIAASRSVACASLWSIRGQQARGPKKPPLAGPERYEFVIARDVTTSMGL
jgi:hypothetical protein